MAFQEKGISTFSFKNYSIAAPIYFGLMNSLSLFMGKSFEMSLQKRLFVISIISIVFIVSLNYFYSRHIYKPYSTYDAKKWMYYILRNGLKHLIVYNIIMYYIEEYFPKSYLLKVFIIGTSAISYLLTFYNVGLLDKENRITFDYKTFTTVEPIIQGLLFVFCAIVLKNALNIC